MEGQGIYQGRRRISLRGDRGSTAISETVVSQVAGLAAQEVEGVQIEGAWKGGTARAVEGFLHDLDDATGGSGASRVRGVSVEVGEERCAIDLLIAVEYGMSIPSLSEAARRKVISRVEELVGLEVVEVNISVYDVFSLPEGRPHSSTPSLVRQDDRAS